MSLLTFFNTQLYPKTWNLKSEFKCPPVFKRLMNMNRECDGKYSRESFPSGDEGDMEMVCFDSNNSDDSEPREYIAPSVSANTSRKRRRRLTQDVCQNLKRLGDAFLRGSQLLLTRDTDENGDWKKVGEEVSELVAALENRYNHMITRSKKLLLRCLHRRSLAVRVALPGELVGC